MITEEKLREILHKAYSGGGSPEFVAIDGRVHRLMDEHEKGTRKTGYQRLRDLFPSYKGDR